MIRNALGNSSFICGIFIDMKKALDTVNHDIPLSKLNHYGIKRIDFDWFKSYLSSKTQFTNIHNQRSEI